MNIPAIELNDGTRIPQLGFGVFQIEANETASAAEREPSVATRIFRIPCQWAV